MDNFNLLKKSTIALYEEYSKQEYNEQIIENLFNKIVNNNCEISFLSIRFSSNSIHLENKSVVSKNNKRLSITIQNYGTIKKSNLKKWLKEQMLFFDKNYIKNIEKFRSIFNINMVESKLLFVENEISYQNFNEFLSKYNKLKRF